MKDFSRIPETFCFLCCDFQGIPLCKMEREIRKYDTQELNEFLKDLIKAKKFNIRTAIDELLERGYRGEDFLEMREQQMRILRLDQETKTVFTRIIRIIKVCFPNLH